MDRTDRPIPSRGIEAVAVALTLLGLAVALILGAASHGVFHDDDVAHYGLAYYSWGDWHKMLHFWARPGYNIPAMLAARIGGMAACRVFSALQTALVAYLAYRLARMAWPGRRIVALAPLLVWAQPETLTLATTTLTETTAAVYMALGLWLWLRGRRVWACLAWSPMFLTRVETMALVPIIAGGVAGAAWLDAGRSVGGMFRRPWAWACAAALLWAPAAYCLAAWIVDLPSGLHLLNFGREYSDIYGSGGWGHYVLMWSISIGGGMVALVAAGTAGLTRRGWMLAGMAWGLFAVETLLFRFGLFASGGYGRFMVTVAAPAGALAAGGLIRLAEARRLWSPWAVWLFSLAAAGGMAWWWLKVPAWALGTVGGLLAVAPVCLLALQHPRGARLAGRAAIAAALTVNALQLGTQVRPLTGDIYHKAAWQVWQQIEQKGLGNNPMMTTYATAALWRPKHPRFFSSGWDTDQFARAIEAWKQAPPGTIFLIENRPRHRRQGPHWPGLQQALARFGRPVARARRDTAWAEAWIRTDTPPAPQEPAELSG